MKFRLSASLLLGMMLCAFISGAQTFSIKGKVIDTLNSNNLPNASVVLIHAKDSVMETFTRTKPDGSFELKPKTQDKYILMITFPSFADYLDEIDLTNKTTADLGSIIMLSRENLLSEFVLHANKGAIRIKGDTIEYVADSFKTKDGANVEDLLKKLPGLQVNRNGEITAQGEKVEKILVDGEEFFSDDPKVVTKNLQANAIDRVQVFDKKSEQAEFTGIDDGEKIKTINLELKEDKKTGVFGKVEAGGGPSGTVPGGMFENQAMINQFKGKRQLSAFGIMSNTGTIGLGWEDRNKYANSGNTNVEVNEDGGITQYWSGDDDEFGGWDGRYNGKGLPKVWTGGVHYADKWQKDTNHINANYRYAKQNNEMSGNTITQLILPDGGLNKYETNKSFSTAQRHAVDGMYERKIDSLSTIKLYVDGGYSRTQTTNIDTVYNITAIPDSVTKLTDTVSTTNRFTFADVNSIKQNAELTYRKKFKTKGRSLFINFSENLRQAESTDSTNSVISAKTDFIPQNQRRKNTSNSFVLAGKINYTEPLSKTLFLETNYSLNVNNSEIIRTTFSNLTNSVVDSLSTNYAYDILTNTGGTNLRYVDKKITASAGGSVSFANFKQTDRRTDNLPKFNQNYDRLNFFPRANFNYKLGQQSSFSLSYNGATTQPTIDQIQPVRNNVDPLNIAKGNPNLKQQFSHNFSGHYNDYKVLTGRWIWSSVSFNTISNDITQVDNIDANGVRTYSYENINGNYSAWGYVGGGKRIQKWDMNIGASASVNVAHNNTLVNGLKNVSDNNNYGFRLEFGYDKAEKFSIRYNPSINYSDNRATISTNTSSYWTSQHDFDFEVQLPLKFEIGADFNWFIRQKTEVFTSNNNVMLFNAYVSKKFLKNGQLELKAYAYDILNQNKGFQRNAFGNQVTESNYNTITRYGMLSLVWNFSRMGGSGDKKAVTSDETQIIEIK
jgi:hypothetical protein